MPLLKWKGTGIAAVVSLGLALVLGVAALAAMASGGGAERVSVDSSGAELAAASARPALSSDGRFVAFVSLFPRLDGSSVGVVFVRDRRSGTTERVNVARDGGDASSDEPAISADGRFVAFRSAAANLVARDTNGVSDIFVRDRLAGTTERVSVGSLGGQSAGDSFDPAISADGRFVAFRSAGWLVSGKPKAAFDVYVRDRQLKLTELVSVSTAPLDRAYGSSFAPSISADGRYVAFASDAPNLVGDDRNGKRDVFVFDRVNRTTTLGSVGSGGGSADGASDLPSITPDGRSVSFSSDATNLVQGDTNGAVDVFVHDLAFGGITRMSPDSDTHLPSRVAISADGRFVVFRSFTSSAGAPDTGRAGDVFLRDRTTGGLRRVSVTADGGAPDGSSLEPAISSDGSLLAFSSDATNLIVGDRNGQPDVFVRQRPKPPFCCYLLGFAGLWVEPRPMTVVATSDQGASVSYVVSAYDERDPHPSVSCAPASGSTFAIGTTTVSCKATDAAGNASVPVSFTVTVVRPVACRASWASVRTPDDGYHEAFGAVGAVSGSDAWALGRGTLAAHFDGTTWSPVPTAPAFTVDGRSPYFGQSLLAVSALSPTDAWAVGVWGEESSDTLIEHWDGSKWTVVSSPQLPLWSGEFDGVAAVSANDVWAVGATGGDPASFYAHPNTLVEHWDGSSWSVVPSPSPPPDTDNTYGTYLRAVSASGPNDIWAVGGVGSTLQPLIEHWDGTSWSVVPNPQVGTQASLLGVAAIASDDAWAIGRYSDGSASHTVFEHWDGSSWSVVLGPDPGWPYFARVTAVSSGDVWAAGSSEQVAHWDGSSWSLVRVGTTGDHLQAIAAAADGRVFAFGWASTDPQQGRYTSLAKQLCELRVGDSGVSPRTARGIRQGDTVVWTFDRAATRTHSVTDASGMGLFDSGLRPPGASFAYGFSVAGTYGVLDTATGRTSAISMAMAASAASGTVDTAFSLHWATAPPDAGFAYDVQLKRPGATDYVDLRAGTSAPSIRFTPDAGAGVYSFRARLRRLDNGATSGWSAPTSVSVG
jgi:Tol biopolymer transport system component